VVERRTEVQRGERAAAEGRAKRAERWVIDLVEILQVD
jgi:hypothetical protein